MLCEYGKLRGMQAGCLWGVCCHVSRSGFREDAYGRLWWRHRPRGCRGACGGDVWDVCGFVSDVQCAKPFAHARGATGAVWRQRYISDSRRDFDKAVWRGGSGCKKRALHPKRCQPDPDGGGGHSPAGKSFQTIPCSVYITAGILIRREPEWKNIIGWIIFWFSYWCAPSCRFGWRQAMRFPEAVMCRRTPAQRVL